MSARVELHPLGFVVTDEFGASGRQVVGSLVDGEYVPVVFTQRFRAKEYAAARDAHAATFADGGYENPDQYEARELCKQLLREHGVTYAAASTVAL